MASAGICTALLACAPAMYPILLATGAVLETVLLRGARIEVNTLRDAVLPQLNTALEQTRAAYVGGRYTYLELISAQAEYLDAELAMINAAADTHLLRAEIERLSGSALNPESRETNP